MKIELRCVQCGFESVGQPGPLRIYRVPLGESRFYELVCEHGHRTITYLDHEKYEMLFESGANALLDGYGREAVASFASAVERFHEYVIRVLMLKRGYDTEKVEPTWKRVASSSERQFGALVFLYHAELGEPLPSEWEKQADFRNAVIHKGQIPTEAKATAYGEMCLSHITKVRERLRQTHGEELTRQAEMANWHLEEMRRHPEGTKFAGAWVSTLVMLAGTPPEHGGHTLASWLEDCRSRKAVEGSDG